VRGGLLTLGATLALVSTIGATPAFAAQRPSLTVHAHYVARDRNIGFSGIALPGGTSMLVELEFRLEQKSGSGWRPISTWMALITGIGARWNVNGHYTSQLMAMNEPVPAGSLRVEMHVKDSDGGQTTAYSNPVHVP
jgi:hypothetical protein